MLDVDQARAVTLTEVERAVDLLAEAAGPDWTRATRCPGWDVAALAHHLTAVLAVYAEVAWRLAVGDERRVSLPDRVPRHDRGRTLEILRDRQRRFEHALAALTPQAKARRLPHPFIDVAGDLGINLFALEFGLHADDLAHALDDPRPLPQEVAHAALAFASDRMGSWADRPDARRPSAPVRFLLSGSTVRIDLSWDGQAWATDRSTPAPGCEIRGEDGALALFLYGREPLDPAKLRVSGDHALARELKAYFPGP